ncbi:unnamed protein product [Agarophyton chilense]|eukprot:gb/GEZJ01002628.1/.p1 GENE.gb/GEZJ01002628.1/~~gb/GEZJ01002628.1/.p1  ORF type:complete len:302 (-),score=31.87 gb/GEZJ01002628.1/:480-1385(-)
MSQSASNRSFHSVLRLAAAALCIALSSACERSCALRFCGGPAVAFIGAPDAPATPAVCGPVGHGVMRRRALRRVGHTQLRLRGYKRLKRADKLGLNATLFKPVLAPLRFGGSALALSTPLNDRQRQRLHGACAVVRVLEWGDELASRSSARRRRHRRRRWHRRGRRADCVAFRVRVAELRVDLEWDSRDDLDLFVTQPDNKEVFFQSTSNSGHLLRDDNRRACGRATPGGVETAVYARALPTSGAYRVFAEHSRSCAQGATHWRLRIALRGRVISDVSGSSQLPLGGVIHTSVARFNVSSV